MRAAASATAPAIAEAPERRIPAARKQEALPMNAHAQFPLHGRPKTWDALIDGFRDIGGLDGLIDLTIARRDAGASLDEYIEQLLAAFQSREDSDTLNELFEKSRAVGWNMQQPEIERAMAAIKSGASAQEAFDLVQSARTPQGAWDLAFKTYSETRVAYHAAQVSYDSAWAEFQREAPWPKELIDPDGGFYASEGEIKRATNLSFDQKIEKIGAVAAFQPIRDAAQARHRVDELADLQDAAWAPYHFARTVILDATPPTAEAYADKIKVALQGAGDPDDADSRAELDPDNELDGQELLSRVWCDKDAILFRLYQDALRLAGVDRPALHVEHFDMDDWVSRFEGHPGHEITSQGPRYEDLIAWGITDRVMIDDEDAIRRWRDYERSRYEEFHNEPVPDRLSAERPLTAFYVGCESHIERAYLEGDPRRATKLAAWEDYLAKHRGEPTGAYLWRSLAKWQKAAIRAWARERAQERVEAETERLRLGNEPVPPALAVAPDASVGPVLIGREAVRDAWEAASAAEPMAPAT